MADFCPQFVPNDIYKQKSESNLLIALTFLVPEIGLEPIRFVQPRDFKSLVSADSTTRACY